MSVRASNWAWETGRRLRLKQGELLILLRVADHADNDGRCWPGVEGIADYTAMDESTVRRNLKKLEAKGLLHRERRETKRGRGRRSDVINVHLDQAGESPGRSDSDQPGTSPGSSDVTNRANPDDQPGIDGGAYIENRQENHPPSEEGDQRSPSSSGSVDQEISKRLCRFLTEAGGGNPDEKRYGQKQLQDATYLLAHKDRVLLKAMVEWAHGRTYWAPKVLTPTTLRRWWDQLFADYRAATNGRVPGQKSKYDGAVENAA